MEGLTALSGSNPAASLPRYFRKGGIKMLLTSRIKPELQATAGKWEYIGCHCIVSLGAVGVSFTYECAACDNHNLRFIHTLENIEDKRLIFVGIECARALLDASDWEIPQLAENEVKRKERWRIHYKKPGRCSVTVDDLIERGKL